MSSVLTPEVLEQESALIIASTGEIVPVIDADQSTALQMHAWIENYKSAVEYVSSVDELDKAEAVLAAIIKRLRQLNQSANEAEFAVTLTYKRIGDIRGGAARPGNPTGANQYTGGMLQNGNIPPKSQYERKRDWMINKISGEWNRVEPILPRMPSVPPDPSAPMRHPSLFGNWQRHCSQHWTARP